MINLQEIPNFKTDHSLHFTEKISRLCKNGIRFEINRVNWPEKYPKTFPVSVTVAHDGEKIYLYYEIEGEMLRAANTTDFGAVWEDSCVEFFMQREGEKTYRNFECNSLGVLLASQRESRESAVPLTNEMPCIVRRSGIRHYYNGGREVSDWTLYLEIPKRAMGFAGNESLSGQKINANFYKCGDKTVEPHFLSWSPINTPSPDFHTPRFFGTLILT